MYRGVSESGEPFFSVKRRQVVECDPENVTNLNVSSKEMEEGCVFLAILLKLYHDLQPKRMELITRAVADSIFAASQNLSDQLMEK